MLERIKKDKLKFATIMVSIVMFIVGIVITIVNTGNTYAIYDDTSYYLCPLGGGPAQTTVGFENTPYCMLSEVEVATSSFSIGDSLLNVNTCKDYLEEAGGYNYLTAGYCSYEAASCWSCAGNSSLHQWSATDPGTGNDGCPTVWYHDTSKTSSLQCKGVVTNSSCYQCNSQNNILVWGNTTPSSSLCPSGWHVNSKINESNCRYYTITFDIQGGSPELSNQIKAHKVDLTLHSTVPTKTGYNFLGWSTSDDAIGATYAAGDTFISDGNYTLFAVWEPKSYVVTYDGNGGLYDGSETYRDPQRPVYGVDYIVYDNDHFFERDGYIFTGWKDQYGNTWNSGYVNWQYDEDITLYAQWVLNDTSGDDDEEPGIDNPDTKIEYTVDYNANGGVGTTQSSNHTYGESKKLTANGFLRTGYSFVGWATSSNGSVVYSDKEEVTNLSSTSGAIVTLYAVWDANTYKIDYKLNGGVISGNPTSGTYGEDVIIKNPTKTITIVGNDNKMDATISDNISVEQKFTGWTSSTIDTNSAYYDDTAWINGNTKVTSTVFRNLATVDGTMVTLIANWDKFDVTLPTVTKEGYNCSWNLKPDGSGDGYKSGEVVTGLTNSSTSVNLYAICESGTKTDNELDKGPQTGSAFIYIVWIIGSGALGYSVYYFMKKRSEM